MTSVSSVIPPTMTAITMTGPGAPEVLQPRAVPTPRPGAGEILIKVHGAGLNLGDAMHLRRGTMPAPEILGLEVAGEVAGVGPDVTRWKIGDRVCSLMFEGGYAEYSVAQAATTMPVPPNVSMIEAAGLPEAVLTVSTSMFDRARLEPGETVLVHGGAGGIGTFAIQMAVCAGANVIATAGSPKKLQLCLELGAMAAINYKTDDFVGTVHDLTGGRGVDVILDSFGGDYIQRNIDAAAIDGRIVWISLNNGSIAEIDFRQLMTKRIYLSGSTLRGRTKPEKAAVAEQAERRFWPFIEERRIKTVVDSVFPLHDAAGAHRRLESGEHCGKIILSVTETDR